MFKILVKIGNNSRRICYQPPGRHLMSSVAKMMITTSPVNYSADGSARTYEPFDEFIQQRRNQASRSFLVSVQSEQAGTALMSYCSSFGAIANCFFYRNRLQNGFFLVEYKTNFAANSLLRTIVQLPQNEIAVKLLNHFLIFSPNKKCQTTLDTRNNNQRFLVQRGFIGTHKLLTNFHRQSNVEGYVKQLYERTRIDELATRLRFMAALQIETQVSIMFPAVKALPFGSSVNGFGRMGSDLDVVLSLDQMLEPNDVPLRFCSRAQNGSERSHNLVVLQTISKLMESWTSGVSKIQTVMNAKVPIIKYKQSFLELDVDLSANNLSGFYMSEMLYLFGEIDARVRPLTFFVRRWAEEWQITRNIRPGPFISNFTLTCLTLFFLQQLKQPILPTINELKRQARPADKRSITEDVDCMFLRDIRQLQFNTTNTDSLGELIKQFFDFCVNLNFQNIKISLNAGCTLPSTNPVPMHIINPLEPELNVSANVSHMEISKFRGKAKQAGVSFRELGTGRIDLRKFERFFQHREGEIIQKGMKTKIDGNLEGTIYPPTNPSTPRRHSRHSGHSRHSRHRSDSSIRLLTKLT